MNILKSNDAIIILHVDFRMNNNHHKQMSPDSVDSHSSNGTTVTSGVHSEGEDTPDNQQNNEQR